MSLTLFVFSRAATATRHFLVNPWTAVNQDLSVRAVQSLRTPTLVKISPEPEAFVYFVAEFNCSAPPHRHPHSASSNTKQCPLYLPSVLHLSPSDSYLFRSRS
jgi:hypothetical protein